MATNTHISGRLVVLLVQVTEVENDVMSPVQEEDGPNAMSQLARKVRKLSISSMYNFIFGTFYFSNNVSSQPWKTCTDYNVVLQLFTVWCKIKVKS